MHMLFSLSLSRSLIVSRSRSLLVSRSRSRSLALALVVCGALASPAAAADWRAEHADSGLVVFGPPGAAISLLDAAEHRIGRGRLSEEGRWVLAGETADPMLRVLVTPEGRRSLSALFPPVELLGVLPSVISAGLPVIPHIRVTRRQKARVGVGGIRVQVALRCGKRAKKGGAAAVWRLLSDAEGVARPVGDQPAVPTGLPAGCRLEAWGGGARLAGEVTITAGARLALSTDRPVYQPGQTVFVRGLVMASATGEPLAGVPVSFELRRGGDLVRRVKTRTSDYGVASSELKLPDPYRYPAAELRLVVAGQEARRSVRVGRFQIPRLSVTLQPSQAAPKTGSTLRIAVHAARLDGGPVSGAAVSVAAQVDGAVIWRRRGALAQGGSTVVEGPVPDTAGPLSIKATVETSGGDRARARLNLRADDGRALQVFGVPESGRLVPGFVNGVWVITLTPDGEPASGVVTAQTQSGPVTVATGADGVGFGRFLVRKNERAVALVGRAGERRGTGRIRADSSAKAILGLESPVVAPGETLKMSLEAAPKRGLAVFELVVGDGPVASVSARMKQGRAVAELKVPEGAIGAVRVHGWVLDGARLLSDVRVVVVRGKRDLHVSLTPDRARYRPRDEAAVAIVVTDGSGRPVQAALGMVAVDKGLQALGLEQPGIERAVIRLGGRLNNGGVGTPLPDWAATGLYNAAQWVRLAVLSSAASAAVAAPHRRETRVRRRGAAMDAFRPGLERRAKRVGQALTRWYAKRAHKGKPVTLAALVGGAGLSGRSVRDAFGRRLAMRLTPDRCGDHEVSLTSAGVDGRPKTPDDVRVQARFAGYYRRARACRVVSMALAGRGNGGGGAWFGRGQARSARVLRSTVFREEFPETLAVAPSVITDAEGRATWRVRVADSLTTWLVAARAVSLAGGLGGGVAELKVAQPFSVDVSLPGALTLDDVMELPVAVTNRSGRATAVRVTAHATGALAGVLEASLEVGAGETETAVLKVSAVRVGEGTIEVSAHGAGVADGVRRRLQVESGGVPVEVVSAGTLSAGRPEVASLAVPEGGIPGTRRVTLRIYPSKVSAAVEGLESLLRAPSGCFEQTSSTTYPNALVLDYLGRSGQGNPTVASRARALLEAGWKRLRSFEVKGGGFSWFGDAPANRVLTAFGIMEFERMAGHIAVDPAVRKRTWAWLLAQRRPDGSFEPDASYLHAESWSKVQNAALPVTAYITWALAQGGASAEALAPSVAYLTAHAAAANDAYVSGLVALALGASAPESAAAEAARARLATFGVETEGARFFRAVGATHTFAKGASANIETTALGALALFKGSSTARSEGRAALDWLMAQRQAGGGWMTTQGTVLALEALLTAPGKATPARGRIEVGTDGGAVRPLRMTAQNVGVVAARSLPTLAGERVVRLALQGEGRVRWQLSAVRQVPAAEAPAAVDRPLSLSITPDRTALRRGERVRMDLVLTAGAAEVRMPTVSVGLPAGFEFDGAALDGAPEIAKHEVLGRRLVLYLTKLGAGASLRTSFELEARRVGTVSAGVARAWPYYEPDQSAYIEQARFVVRR